MKDPTVLQAKTYGVYSCTRGQTLLEAARRMAEEDISALVVVDEAGYLSGIITRTDLLRAKMECQEWQAQPVEAWMSKEVITVSPQERLSEVTHLLLDRQIHRVVAVEEENGKQRPLVVISSADLVYHMARGNI